MDQNGLIALLRKRLVESLDEKGWGDFEVSQKFQPTQQGVPMRRGVFIQPLFDDEHGWHGHEDLYNEVTGSFDTTEPQAMETTFQISCLAVQQAEDVPGPNNPTAADVVKHLARALASRKTIESFRKVNVRMLRPREIKNDPFLDDRDRSEYHASFDIVLTHSESYGYSTPKIDRITGKDYPV